MTIFVTSRNDRKEGKKCPLHSGICGDGRAAQKAQQEQAAEKPVEATEEQAAEKPVEKPKRGRVKKDDV